MTTAVGGGTLRDMLLRQVPEVQHTGLYAVLCFALRLVGLGLNFNAPGPPGQRPAQPVG